MTGASSSDEMLGDFEGEMDRKRASLDKRLDHLDSDDPEDRNEILAENDVQWELGVFSLETAKYWEAAKSSLNLSFENVPGQEWTPERERGFIIRARSDALKSRINTRTILAEMRKTQETLFELQRIQRAIGNVLAVITVLTAAVAFKLLW
jgi:hypothetical protein